MSDLNAQIARDAQAAHDDAQAVALIEGAAKFLIVALVALAAVLTIVY